MMTDIEEKLGNSKPKRKGKDKQPTKKEKEPTKKERKRIEITDESIKELLILKDLNSETRHPHPIRISEEMLTKVRVGSKKKEINLWEYISLAIWRQLERDGLV